MNSEDLIGKWFVFFDKNGDGGSQGTFVANLDQGYYLVKMFSWSDVQYESHLWSKIVHLNATAEWLIFDTQEEHTKFKQMMAKA
jgi:hypothetical protein